MDVPESRNKREIDYILVDRSSRKHLQTCSVHSDIDIGSDHRPLSIRLSCTPARRHKKRRRHKQRWAVNVEAYKQALDESIDAASIQTGDVDSKTEFLEKVMLEAAEGTRRISSDECECNVDHKRVRIRQLITERRLVQADNLLSSEVKAIKRR